MAEEEVCDSSSMEINSDDDDGSECGLFEVFPFLTLPCGKKFYGNIPWLDTFMGRTHKRVSRFFFFYTIIFQHFRF
jgi:hypothetical protein